MTWGAQRGLGGLTQSADGAVVGLVAQGVGARVTQAEVATGQDQRVPHVGETHHALGTVIANLILSDLAGGRADSQCHKDSHDHGLFYYSSVCFMRIGFKVFTESVTIVPLFFYFYILVFSLQGMWDLSLLTRD